MVLKNIVLEWFGPLKMWKISVKSEQPDAFYYSKICATRCIFATNKSEIFKILSFFFSLSLCLTCVLFRNDLCALGM